MEKDTQQELERLDQALQAAEEEPETEEQAEETVSEEDYLWATEGVDPEEEPQDYDEEYEDYEQASEEAYYTEGDTEPKKPGHIWFPILALVLMALGTGYILWQYLGVLK